MKDGDGTDELTTCVTCHTDVFNPDSKLNLKHDHNKHAGKDFACENCHGSMKVGEGLVPKENCYNCHWERKWLEKYDNPEFLHRKYITEHKVECSRCHVPIKHSSISKTAHFAGDYLQCHGNIHVPEEKVFKGEYGGLVESSPSIKFSEGMTCKACHIYEKKLRDGTEVSIAKKETCVRCHNPGFSNLYLEWEEAGENRIKRINNAIAKLAPAVEKLDDPKKKQEASEFIETARKSTELVAYGHHVHNPEFSKRVLAEAAEALEKTAVAVGEQEAVAEVTRSFIKYDIRCLDCHVYIEEKEVTAFEINFSHRRHTVDSGVKCTECHQISDKYDGVPHGKVTRESLQSYLKCHHTLEKAKETCGNCHETQKSVFGGKVPWSEEEMSSVMHEAEIGCMGCHFNDDKNIIKPTKDICLRCHDEGYDKILEDWQSETTALLKKAKAMAGAGKLSESDLKGLKFIDEGRCNGMHNYNVIIKFLKGTTGKAE